MIRSDQDQIREKFRGQLQLPAPQACEGMLGGAAWQVIRSDQDQIREKFREQLQLPLPQTCVGDFGKGMAKGCERVVKVQVTKVVLWAVAAASASECRQRGVAKECEVQGTEVVMWAAAAACVSGH